jgi:hypothetical protein
MSSAGFEPAIPAIERPQTCARLLESACSFGWAVVMERVMWKFRPQIFLSCPGPTRSLSDETLSVAQVMQRTVKLQDDLQCR